MSAKKRTAYDERMARRWGVSDRTVLNWRRAAEKAGEACPMDTENPDVFFEWYRSVMGREPSGKLKEAGRRISKESGEGVELKTETEIDRAPLELIEKALGLLGKSATLARALAEEEIASKIYEEARLEGTASATLRKNWADAAAMAQSARKQDDAVEVALELLKEWVRRELEPKERERRKKLSAQELGASIRERLLEAKSVREWERVWDEGVGKALEV